MTATKYPATTKLCLCGRRNNSALDVCPTCMEQRRQECVDNRKNPNFKPRNPACNYGWHATVLECQLCRKEGIYGTTGCKPCEKCHLCNEVHPVAA